jgi:Leu/Phe-tRNA-protein transferase
MIRYTSSGYIFISPGDDPDSIVEAVLETAYPEEFCLALDFSPSFIARLMAAGFLVMSMETESGAEGAAFLLLPKFHLERTVLFFPDLHVGKTTGRLLPQYELRADQDFDRIMERCAEKHGEDWLTPPLREGLRLLHEAPGLNSRPCSFALYREGVLRAGEFGVISGGVYTSYSGYYDENSAGMVQMVLTARYLRDAGFAFWDLGMPLEYKVHLGARTVDRTQFAGLFREGRSIKPGPV